MSKNTYNTQKIVDFLDGQGNLCIHTYVFRNPPFLFFILSRSWVNNWDISWAADVMSANFFAPLLLMSSVLNYSFNFMYSSFSANIYHTGLSFNVKTKYILILTLCLVCISHSKVCFIHSYTNYDIFMSAPFLLHFDRALLGLLTIIYS